MTTLGRSAAVTLLALAVTARLAAGDELRNVKVGQAMPKFSLRTLDGGTIGSADLADKAYVLVFVAAQQHSSELATQSASKVVEGLLRDDLTLVFATADTTRLDYFREDRDRLSVHAPLALDFTRSLYGDLGLIVLPTTVVADKEGKLRHVISSYKSDYEHVLAAYVRHALGVINDAQLQDELATKTYERNRLAERVARHRSAARLLRERGLPEDAEHELKTALEIDPENADVRLDLASLYLATGDVANARTLVDQVLAKEPDHRRAQLILGAVLYNEERLDEAQAVLERVLLLNPDPVYTHYYLGLIAERKGDAAKAAEHFREALSRLLEDRVM